MKKAWAALAGRIGGAASWPIKDTLQRWLPPPSAWLSPAASRLHRLRRATHRPSLAAAVHPSGYLRLVLHYIRRALRAMTVAVAVLGLVVVALVVAYRWVNPPISTLMLGQSIAGTAIERTWVPIERVSPYLIRAVLLAEDGRFCRHSGVDWHAIREAIAQDRGGSTITMQVVKNLFLWPSRSYVRKVIEMGLAYMVDLVWPKRRILEIYLNIAEWGDGVFGAEAAAQTHFGKSAARLTPEEAALMAVALPSPVERAPGLPGAGTDRLAEQLLVRMDISGADLTCVQGASHAQSVHRTRPPSKPVQSKPKAEPKEEWNYLFPGAN